MVASGACLACADAVHQSPRSDAISPVCYFTPCPLCADRLYHFYVVRALPPACSASAMKETHAPVCARRLFCLGHLLALHLQGPARGPVPPRCAARHGACTRVPTGVVAETRLDWTSTDLTGCCRHLQKTGAHQYPTVVVQLPMFNEREVCRQVIEACCELEWPRDALMVQVLDLSLIHI
jgi:hypothetical protein